MTGTSFYSVEKHADGHTGGSTQTETRLYNERLILSLIRRKKALSKVELVHLTGLSPQTISTIVNRCAAAGLLRRGEPLRGRLGQPSVPYSLNPAGVHSLGLNIGRKSAGLTLLDFLGAVIARTELAYDYPTPECVLAFARQGIPKLLAGARVDAKRVAGLGIASPMEIWMWPSDGIPAGSLGGWRRIDVRAELDRDFAWPVYLLSDSMMAAAAELMFGCGETAADFLALNVGYVVGGGVVLDHRLFPGNNRRAGAFGDMLVPSPEEPGRLTLLSAVASLHALAARTGADGAALLAHADAWPDLGATLDSWVETTSATLAFAIGNAVALVDVNTAVIDGAVPAAVRRAIAKGVRQRLAPVVVNRPEPFTVLEGRFGALAPELGAAAIPLLVRYSNDRDVLFKDWDTAVSAQGEAVAPALKSVAG